MFRGIHMINVDEKNRIAIPTRYRARLHEEANGQLILTVDTDQRCLLLYPFLEWQKIEQKVTKLPSLHPASRRIQRLLIGHATEVELDGQGRIVLPTMLRHFADVEKKAVLLGQGNKFELWDEIHWQTCRENWLKSQFQDDDWPEELKDLSI